MQHRPAASGFPPLVVILDLSILTKSVSFGEGVALCPGLIFWRSPSKQEAYLNDRLPGLKPHMAVAGTRNAQTCVGGHADSLIDRLACALGPRPVARTPNLHCSPPERVGFASRKIHTRLLNLNFHHCFEFQQMPASPRGLTCASDWPSNTILKAGSRSILGSYYVKVTACSRWSFSNSLIRGLSSF